MNTILTDLYYALIPNMMSAEERDIIEENFDQLERIESQLSPSDLSLYLDIQAKLCGYRAESAFAFGFRLAMKLMASIQAEI